MGQKFLIYLQTLRAQRRTARLFRGTKLPLCEEELNELQPLSWVDKEGRCDRGLWNQAGHQKDGNCDTRTRRCQRKLVRAQLKEIRSRWFRECSWMLSRKLWMLKVFITCGKVDQLMEKKSTDCQWTGRNPARSSVSWEWQALGARGKDVGI